ncbi:MAG: cytochrome c3 family protein [Saprospiraceae bacterium]
MKHLKIIILFVGFLLKIDVVEGQSPHGENFIIDCSKCHNSENWTFNALESTFDHDSTDFILKGQHQNLECRSCHQSLEFNKAESGCLSCHNDIHQQTVGYDCARCHNSVSWVVENITLMHEQTSFPLIGLHVSLDCIACHVSETNLRFDPIRPECISCHRSDFTQVKMPDHVGQGFPEDCTLCHKQTGTGWIGEGIVHSFFPLEQGHEINDCTQCHKSSIYSVINPACINCHMDDFNNANNPDHTLFPTECNLCHTLAIGWRPASFSNHDSRFPIYSGNHKGEWDQCIDCHTIAGDFNTFSCIDCHEHNNAGKMAKEHDDVNNYQFVSTACYGCHPRGN